MTTFVDGPAKGQTLMLKRAARFLRVTEENGKFDALDQLGDSPKAAEKLFAYEIEGPPGYAFVDFGGKQRTASGRYAIASYRFVPEQPSDDRLRNEELWDAWCKEMANKTPSHL